MGPGYKELTGEFKPIRNWETSNEYYTLDIILSLIMLEDNILENWEQQRWTSMIGREDSYNLSWYPTKLTITNSSNNSLLIITLNSPTYGHLISTRESIVCSIGYTKVAKGFSLMGDGPQIYYDWDMWRGPN